MKRTLADDRGNCMSVGRRMIMLESNQNFFFSTRLLREVAKSLKKNRGRVVFITEWED